MRWWADLTRIQRLVLTVAWLGWVADIADTALFNLAKGPMMTEFLGGAAAYKLSGAAIEGHIQTVFLIGWALGGLIFGLLADTWGRARTLTLTIFLYCLFTGLTALCKSPDQVAVIRFLTGLGIGGEWAAGAALVAETLPDKARAGAATVLQSAAAFGPVLAAIANIWLVKLNPSFGIWRGLFIVGIAPAALIFLARKVSFGNEARTTEKSKVSFEPLKELWSVPKWRKLTILTLILGFVGIAGAGNVSFWLPNLVKSVSVGIPDLEIQGRQSYATFALHAGTILGVIVFPILCQAWGRKKAFGLFFAAAPLSLLCVGYGATSYSSLLLLAPLMSFFTIGLTAGFALYFPELFPKKMRATGIGTAYNTGRILNAPVPAVTGEIIKHYNGNILAGVVTTAAIYAIGWITLPFAPETRSVNLADVDALAEA